MCRLLQIAVVIAVCAAGIAAIYGGLVPIAEIAWATHVGHY